MQSPGKIYFPRGHQNKVEGTVGKLSQDKKGVRKEQP